MNLEQIEIEKNAVIHSLEKLEPTLQKRLQALGVKTGSLVKMNQKSLLGGPCIFECKGKLISIRRKDAKNIEVRNHD